MPTTIDKPFLKTFGAELGAVLTQLAQKHGLKLVRNGGTYSPTEFKPKLSFVLTDSAGQDLHAKREFERYAEIFGLKATDLGKEFISQGNMYRVVGLDLKKRKFPVRCQNVETGKIMLFTPECATRATVNSVTP